MKNKLLIAFIALPFFVFSQQKTEVKNIFKLNIIPVFSNIYEFQYERIFGKQTSIQVGFASGKKEITNRDDFQDLHLNTFGRTLNNPKNTSYTENTSTFNIDFKYYFTDEIIPKGLYFSPSIQYIKYSEKFYALEMDSWGNLDGTFNYDERIRERKFKLYNIRTIIGYQMVLTKRIVLNPYFGPGVAFGKAEDFFGREDKDAKGFSLNAGIFIGIGF